MKKYVLLLVLGMAMFAAGFVMQTRAQDTLSGCSAWSGCTMTIDNEYCRYAAITCGDCSNRPIHQQACCHVILGTCINSTRTEIFFPTGIFSYCDFHCSVAS